MGLVSAILLAPLAPVRGVVWVAEKMQGAAEREMYDTGVIRAQLAALNQEFERGEIGVEKFEREEEVLLERLHVAQARTVGRAHPVPNDRR
ncbi:gas vesicle protein GvpG [Streptomyces nitrosporeus]|uniref:Gas vesicle protein n=1 Tax=Streptomyces nitrosporeus TaxID=28894 RepID=A0A5J6FJN7_9ACTN|nr:gas vesicle protein GvpG [Streptomyces nitrosporeus]QEU76201.1 gas vesicle protein [Streptomyces nitrosporeus]GGZ08643.1 gas vesicle protein [Streptomyces nitrosporeus]